MVDMDIELTSVETVSQRSQSGIPNEDGEDELSIQRPSLDEHTSQHTLPLNIPDASSKELASSVIAHSVKRLSQNKAADLITLPSATLEEWLKHGIRILRENRRRTKTAGSDPEYGALEIDPDLEHLDQTNVKISSSQGRVSGSQSDGKLRQQPTDDLSYKLEDQQWLTTAQRKIIKKIMDRARWDPCNFEEISASSPSENTINRNGLGDFQSSDFDGLYYIGKFRHDGSFEKSFETAWEKYFSKFFYSRSYWSAAHKQWSTAVARTWLRRRLIAIEASKNSVLVGICYAQMLFNNDTDGRDLTIGSVLEFCFDTGVLSRRSVNDKEGIRLLADIMPIFNDYLRLEPNLQPESHRPVSYSQNFRMWLLHIKTEEALALELHEFMLIIRFLKVESTFPISRIDDPSPTSLMLNDLNFESLKEIGGLQLVWTDVLEEHFLLNPETKQLFVTFFGSVEQFRKSVRFTRTYRYQFDYTPIWNAFDPTSEPESCGSRMIDDIYKTWDLLNSASEDHRKLYRSIITWDGCPTEKLWKDTHKITSSEYSFLERYHDPPSHKIEFALQNKSELPYTHFGTLGYRVRILREYMDKQKPRGFRQLWRDTRDSFNYYTFWGIIIFGAVSIFLAMASLAVSIAQTYASFKALG